MDIMFVAHAALYSVNITLPMLHQAYWHKCIDKLFSLAVPAGAMGDGKHLDTRAIQGALDECNTKEDGGVVELAAGKTYLSGNLRLPSRVTLRLLKGSTLQASTDVRIAATPSTSKLSHLHGRGLNFQIYFHQHQAETWGLISYASRIFFSARLEGSCLA